ncbi:nuclease, EndA/NucM family [Bacteriovorax sp. BSW11_IV]|uniref:endonuclease I family protein n=1 Tax=Bacteriovorax sp. BSW11_IV TaxID=1353529 RepID=UPI00038A4549|nr:endonuclease [Bacteriovorax sp. BSW11_IV]EQC48164.1 nuclease, EndA/NucM family [Bacteriovorax sp. BSW11_IV]
MGGIFLREVPIKSILFLTLSVLNFSSFAYTHFKGDKSWSDLKTQLQEKREYRDLVGLDNKSLKEKLGKIAASGYRSLSYDQARLIMFTIIDNVDGEVCSVYSNHECIITYEIPNNQVMNAEHTWPKSLGAGTVPAKSDLHHLYPTTNHANSVRSSLPFCEVVRSDWENDGSRRGVDGDDHHCFEPPAYHRGNVARSLFYFAIRYGHSIDDKDEEVLRKWHHEDPVTDQDIERNEKIKSYQRNSNPFVDIPDLVDMVDNF